MNKMLRKWKQLAKYLSQRRRRTRKQRKSFDRWYKKHRALTNE